MAWIVRFNANAWECSMTIHANTVTQRDKRSLYADAIIIEIDEDIIEITEE